MFDKNLTHVLRLTAQMENHAANGEWGVVQELDEARLAELEQMIYSDKRDVKETSETLECLLQSNRSIAALAREAKSSLKLEQQQLLLGKKATHSYQQVQEEL